MPLLSSCNGNGKITYQSMTHRPILGLDVLFIIERNYRKVISSAEIDSL